MNNLNYIYDKLGISNKVLRLAQEAESALVERFNEIDKVAEYNQAKVLYAFQKNNMYLVIGIVFALVVSVFVVIIISLNRKLKKQEESFNEKIERLGIDDLKKEKEELLKSMEYLKERISDVEHEREDIEQEIERLEQELELFTQTSHSKLGHKACMNAG